MSQYCKTLMKNIAIEELKPINLRRKLAFILQYKALSRDFGDYNIFIFTI